MAGYDNNFYETIRRGSVASSKVIIPIVYDLVQPQTVVDVGGGEGWFVKEFEEAYDCDVTCIDGDYVRKPAVKNFIPFDFSVHFPVLERTFDLVVCLEVAEHLPAKRASSFADDLCSLGDTLLFSAAIPGQPGVNHINCQWPTYWQKFFRNNGYEMSGKLRDAIWADDRVEPWYRQNLMLITNEPTRFPDLFPGEDLNKTHPIIKSWMR